MALASYFLVFLLSGRCIQQGSLDSLKNFPKVMDLWDKHIYTDLNGTKMQTS